MSYLASMLANVGGQKLGTPPSRQAPNVGVPPAQPHIEPAPYDVAMDAAWKGVVDPNDHELRNFLNGLSPEERQMLITRLGRLIAPRNIPPTPNIPAGAAATPAPLPTGQVPV